MTTEDGPEGDFGRKVTVAEAAQYLEDDPHQTWVEYVTMGGSLSAEQVRAALDGSHDLPDAEHNRLAAALNDHFVDRGQDHPVAYRPAANDSAEPGEHGVSAP